MTSCRRELDRSTIRILYKNTLKWIDVYVRVCVCGVCVNVCVRVGDSETRTVSYSLLFFFSAP